MAPLMKYLLCLLILCTAPLCAVKKKKVNAFDITTVRRKPMITFTGYNKNKTTVAINGIILNSTTQETPLQFFIQQCPQNDKEAAIIRRLINLGAQIDKTNKYGHTALYTSVLINNINIARILLQHKANPNAPDMLGETPISIAKALKNTPMIDLLKKYGADDNKPPYNEYKYRTVLSEKTKKAVYQLPQEDQEEYHNILRKLPDPEKHASSFMQLIYFLKKLDLPGIIQETQSQV